MKRTLTRAAIVLLLVLVVPASLALVGACLPACYSETYYAELAPMVRRLEQAEGKRLVMVGGSSVAFGLDGALLEELLSENGFSYTVCPFGLYAAVGTSAMLELSLKELREGDVVVLAMEPVSEAMSTYFGATAYWKCSEEAPELLLRLNKTQTAALAGSYVGYLQERFAICRSGSFPGADGVYAKSSFDDRCDLVYDRAGNRMQLGYDTSQKVDLAALQIEPAFAEEVNRYCAGAMERGAKVYLSFAPVNRASLSDASAEKEAADALFTLCNETFSCAVISDPERYIMDSGWFYDSNFHLNTAGARLRTILLAEDLLAELGCPKPVSCERPSMPASIAGAVPEDPADDGAFTFEAVPGADGSPAGYLVSGAERTSALTVPSSHDGKPVVGFTEDALAGHTELTELTLPATIESLPDGLFKDCTGLLRLTLLHRDKLCRVTEHTFDGCDRLRFYVPMSMVTLYRGGQGCEANAWEPYRDRIIGF